MSIDEKAIINLEAVIRIPQIYTIYKTKKFIILIKIYGFGCD